MAVSPSLKIRWPFATKRTRSTLRAFEPATLRCWKRTPISSTPPQIPCAQFAKGSRRYSNTGYGGAQGSVQLDRTSLEVLLHPPRSLPPTLKGCWRSQGSPLGRPLALRPQQQEQPRRSLRERRPFVVVFYHWETLSKPRCHRVSSFLNMFVILGVI